MRQCCWLPSSCRRRLILAASPEGYSSLVHWAVFIDTGLRFSLGVSTFFRHPPFAHSSSPSRYQCMGAIMGCFNSKVTHDFAKAKNPVQELSNRSNHKNSLRLQASDGESLKTLTFKHIMRDPLGRAHFMMFLKIEHAEENMLFFEVSRLSPPPNPCCSCCPVTDRALSSTGGREAEGRRRGQAEGELHGVG